MNKVDPNQVLVRWLSDAYAMENEIVQNLKRQSDQTDNTELKTKIDEHIEVSLQHAEMVKSAVDALGGSISTVKEGISKIMGNITGVSTAMADDKLIKNAVMNYGVENMEMAVYSTIIFLAEELELEDVVSMCESIIDDEEEMSAWIEDNLEELVMSYVGKE